MVQNIHLLKALDNYPYNIEDCIESLNYALALESENAVALCLMGRIQAEILKDFETAKSYFQQALFADKRYCEIYPNFIETLYELEEYSEALRLVEFALKIKGVKKGAILYKKAEIFDQMNEHKKALKTLDETVLHARNQSFIDDIEAFKRLIERKKNFGTNKTKNKGQKNN